MITILFPTDFSDNAAKALDYAIPIVNQLKGHITIVHASNISSTGGAFVSTANFILADAEKEMTRIVNQIKSRLTKGVTFDTIIKREATIPLLNQLSQKYDLVIMGTQGASGLKEIFIGSITNGVIKHTKTPVLTIPNNFEFKPIKNIVLSIDDRPISNGKVVQLLKKLVDSFKANLMLFHTEEKAADKGIDPSVNEYFGEVDYSIDFNFIEKGINESIEEMIIDYDVDLVCMIRRERSFFANFFHKSATSKEVFHSPIPLLVLHDI